MKVIPAARSEGQVIISEERLDALGKSIPWHGAPHHLRPAPPDRQVPRRGQPAGDAAPCGRRPGSAGGEEEHPHRLVLPVHPPGVEVASIVPESLIITFDGAEEGEFAVEPVYQKLPEGMEVETPKIKPAKVTLRGPRSLLKGMRVIAEAWLGAADRFEDTLPLAIRFPETFDRSLVERTVRFAGPSQVRFSVRLRYKSDSLDAEGGPGEVPPPPGSRSASSSTRSRSRCGSRGRCRRSDASASG